MADKPPTPEPTAPVRKPADPVSSQFALAMELPFVMVSAIVVGGLFGWVLDRWLHTKPILMLILGGVGFFAGVRDVLRRLDRSSGDGRKTP